MKSPTYTGYGIGTYRAHDEHHSLYSLHSSEEYRHMKRGFFRDESHDERGGGDDGDGSEYEYRSNRS